MTKKVISIFTSNKNRIKIAFDPASFIYTLISFLRQFSKIHPSNPLQEIGLVLQFTWISYALIGAFSVTGDAILPHQEQ